MGTFYRKTVIWMETLVLENMARVMRVMAGVRRTAAPQRELGDVESLCDLMLNHLKLMPDCLHLMTETRGPQGATS